MRLGEKPGEHGADLTTLTISRIFGPVLGIGVLLGIALLFVTGIPALSPWLVASYVFITLALVFQGAFAVPWHLRTSSAASSGASLDPAAYARTATLIAAAFALPFIFIVALMVMKPYAL